MSDPCPQYGRIPFGVIDAGGAANLRPAAAKVYLVLAAHADADWCCRVGMRRLARLAGVLPSSVSRSVGQLRAAGLIETEAAGNGHPFTYRLVTEPQSDRSPASECMTVRPAANGSRGDRSPTGGGAVRSRARNRSPSGEQNRENRLEQSTASEFSFPLRGRGEWTLPADRLGEYHQTFPGLDVDAELRKARLWLVDNPERRKTDRGMPRFLSGWLTRAKTTNPGTANESNGTTIDLDADPVEPPDDIFAKDAA